MIADTRVTELHDNETGVLFQHTTYEDFSVSEEMVHLDQLANAFTCAAEARWLRDGARMIIDGMASDSLSEAEKTRFISLFGFATTVANGQLDIDERSLSFRLQCLEEREMELRFISQIKASAAHL
jgi:hypothetical protein